MVNRTVLAHLLLTGLSRQHLACSADELAEPWQAPVKGRRHAARGGVPRRAEGTGTRHQLVFVDQLMTTLVQVPHELPHSVLGLLFGVDRSTVNR
ncbi:transposase family protein [Streptomyces capoamus]|uniref:transposase family protein n=1 Tax=Streptomyces capoamus TaxID=68183 RepID=UPI003C2F0066